MNDFIKAADLVIFKAGTWNGESFTEQDLDNMAKAYSEPIPFIIGHSSDYKGHTRIPAFGRITGGLKRIGRELVATGVEFNAKLAEWIREGFYPQRSIELTRDNKRVLAVGMLGAAPPAVKGLPGNDEALQEIALQFSDMKDSKVIEFTELEAIEGLAVDDTFKTLSDTCMKFLQTIEKMLVDGTNPEKLSTELWEMQAEMCEALNLHEQFLKKIEQMESNQMSERHGWREFVDKIKNLFTKRKESLDMDAQKEQEYQEQIAARDAQIKEFAEKERLAVEAKAKADEEAATAAANAAKEAKQNEVKLFCETAVKENRMTPAEKEADEPRMFTLVDNPEALKSFQEGKYPQGRKAVPVGEMQELNEQQAKPKGKLDLAADYVKAHPKEFSGMSDGQAVARAVYFESIGKVKF